MVQFPVEIWDMVFRLACQDGGSTGRSLAQVSRYIRHISASVQYFSLTIRGAKQVESFLAMVDQAPPDSVRIQHLFITLPEENFIDNDDLTATLRRFYSGPASQLQTLFSSVNGGFNWEWLRAVLPFESLLHLESCAVVHTGVDHHLYFDSLLGSQTEEAHFPRLRRFHVSTMDQPNFNSARLTTRVPHLSDAILTGVLPATYFMDMTARSAIIEILGKCFEDLSSKIRRYTFNVSIKGATPAIVEAFQQCAEALQKEAEKIKPDAQLSMKYVPDFYNEACAYADWLDIIEGGDGCWKQV